jgi:hypothetical protein
LLDEAVLRRLVDEAGGVTGRVIGRQGSTYLREKARGLLDQVPSWPWVILTDLDQTACAPELVASWVDAHPRRRHLRVAIREVEAWLLGDWSALQDCLDSSMDSPRELPETHADPKLVLLELAANSNSAKIRRQMTPRPGSGSAVGPDYNRVLSNHARVGWRPDLAARRSPSLQRCRRFLAELVHLEQRSGR